MLFKNTRRTLIGSMLILLGTFGVAIQAHAQAYQGEVYVCSLINDADIDDVLKARDFYVSQAEKEGLTLPPSFLWTPIKGDSTADFLWFSYYENATQYGQLADASAASSEMDKVTERFARISDCNSFLLSQEEIYNGGEEISTAQSYIQASACTYQHGAGPSALVDLKSHLKGYFDGAGTHKSYSLFQQNSMTPGPDTPDVRFFSVHNNATDWGTRLDAMQASEGGQALRRHFRSVVDCSTSHWGGQQVIAFPDPDQG